MLIDIVNDHGLEQLVHFPTREKNTLDLILTSLPGQFQELHSPDKLNDHDVVSGTLKVYILPKKPRRKVYLYHKGDFELMRKDVSDFAKDRYFNGYSDNLLSLLFLVNFKKYIPQTNLVSMMSSQELWKFTFPPKRNLGGRCISITKEILSQWGKMHLTLQKIGTSMVTQIIARFRKTLIW